MPTCIAPTPKEAGRWRKSSRTFICVACSGLPTLSVCVTRRRCLCSARYWDTMPSVRYRCHPRRSQRVLPALAMPLEVCLPAVDLAIANKQLEMPTLGRMTIAEWMPLLIGHLLEHTEQARAILRTRGVLPCRKREH